MSRLSDINVSQYYLHILASDVPDELEQGQDILQEFAPLPNGFQYTDQYCHIAYIAKRDNDAELLEDLRVWAKECKYNAENTELS